MDRAIVRNLLANARFPPEDFPFALAWLARKKVMKTDAVTFQWHFGLGAPRSIILSEHFPGLVCIVHAQVLEGDAPEEWGILCVKLCLKRITFSHGQANIRPS
jgi:hypothetical protein